MKFIPVRDLRLKSGEIWQQLKKEKEAVITSNGKPIALMLDVTEEDIMEYLADLRRMRAIRAVNKLQDNARQSGKDRIKEKEIEEEIKMVRKSRVR
jgi:antitoxin (DNA-binding transcriptional repressor) of toxin-antitoxin stability system